MNQNWKNFLLSQNAIFESDTCISFPAKEEDTGKTICSVAHLAVLTVSGKDAAKLLQGQITCNVNDVTEIKSSLGALCNPKGRAITTFLLVKAGDVFLMVLPEELLEPVKKRLQMVVLRSDVTLTDSSCRFCLVGLCHPAHQAETVFATTQNEIISVSLSATQGRSLVIAEADQGDCPVVRPGRPSGLSAGRLGAMALSRYTLWYTLAYDRNVRRVYSTNA
jgi:folate-binding Fe-S cluster repair protein YgfZ